MAFVRRPGKAKLSAEERERLYETLLVSLQEGSDRDEAEFRDEIRSRREAFLSGEISARPFAEARA
jgi:hypothetical protein